MKTFVTVLMLALWAGLPVVVAAQTARPLQMPKASQAGPDGLIKVHVTDALNSTPEAREALAEFHRLKAAGLLPPARKTADALGDTLTFKVLNISTQGGGQLDDIDFELVAIDPADPPRFQIWVELAELAEGTVNQALVDSLVLALGERTPPRSYNPNAGIIENNETLFGDPPDVDGDGITDVLVLDIRDDYDPPDNRSFTAGFVLGNDLRPGGGGNTRDILYLDSDPSIIERGIVEAEITAAHEYQHLIHFNYDNNEESFINEGLSEWGEVALGYPGRAVDYLIDPDRYNVSLMRFLRDNPFDDYQRGAMFINYIADRFGMFPDASDRGGIGKITRDTQSGSAGLRSSLRNMQAGITLEELIFDYHVAVYFNDTSLDPRYGYTTEQRQGLRATAGARFDGRIDEETPQTQARVQEGGVQYVLWEQVTDFTLTLSTANATDLRAEAFLFGTDGSFQGATPLSFSQDNTFDGEFGRIVAVFAHVNPDGSDRLFDYSAQWAAQQTEVSLLTTQYDNGQANAPNGGNPFFSLINATNPGAATRFVVPFSDRATMLDRVWLAPYYFNQFVDQNNNPIGSPNDPRDLTFQIWALGPNGAPGDVIFSMEMDDPRAYAPATSRTLSFFELDLTPFASDLAALPDTIYIGYTNAGTDNNSFIFTVSPYNVASVSAVSSNVDEGWGPLWGVGSESSTPYEGTVIPIRAQFVIPTAVAVAEGAEVPEQIALHPNFPNPFNPVTSVRYSLPRATEVRLAVYDLLGREMAVLVDGLGAPGQYEVQINAGEWASGVYFYTLQTAEQTLTQRMVLVK